MTNPLELFEELESFNVQKQESAKQKFAEAFASTKESWIINGMIDYYSQTNSFRIVEVLVRVQTPHDINIFNKLQKCLQESNPKQKTVALTLFAHIVRKHPTWLYKVVSHGFLKDLLKFLRYERDVITLITGLLCIISLLPIIPTSISAFLTDLFEIFNYVATLTCQQLNLTECHLTYLQYGLYMLFNRLYGMYPCNFIDFIRNEYILKPDKAIIFNHTIRGLLDTVKIHPNLITSTKISETSTSRFKKMEPHDVVVECVKYSIDNNEKSATSCSSGFLDCEHLKPLEFTHLSVEPLPPLPAKYYASAKSIENRFESLWTPSLVVQATPPPTANNITNTPSQTPVPIAPNYNIALANKNTQEVICDTDDSTRLVEAAIEATPEPEIGNSNFRPFTSTSQAARNIWPKPSNTNSQVIHNVKNSSTPSSPLRKEGKAPDYSIPNHKLMRILSDREQHVSSATGEPIMISREDQEVNDINNFNSNNGNDQEIDAYRNMVDYNQSDEDDADTTPPLYQRVDYVRKVKRLRLYSHCIYSAGTSPADSINYMPRIPSTFRMKRFNSWPNLKFSDVVIKSSKFDKQNVSDPQQSSSDEAFSAESHFNKRAVQNGDSSARNGSIFKKIREDLKSKPLEILQKVSSGTQTLEYWPSASESMFYNIFEKEMKKKQIENEIVTLTQTTTTTTTTTLAKSSTEASTSGNVVNAASTSPNEMIDQYIQTSLKRKNSNDYRDHIELLAIQLQFEKHRREIHAERNRRLLGKSRAMRGLEQSNATLSDQVAKLSAEINLINRKSAETRSINQKSLKDLEEKANFWAKKCAEEKEKNVQLQRERDSLQLMIEDEVAQKKEALSKIDVLSAENFDLKNLYEDAKAEAERGQQYREQLKKLEADMIIFNEARLKCQQQMDELNAIKERDVEMENIIQSYSQEILDMRRILDFKSSQIDGMTKRMNDYELQIQKKDSSLTDLKRKMETIKEVYEEKFKALEEKYTNQKAIIMKMEEHALELSKNQQGITSPESDKTDLLGYTSPLSISLASSDGLSVSLRSTTELRGIGIQQIMQPSTSGVSSLEQQAQQQPVLQRQQSIHDDSTLNQPINYKKK
ncbi:hypothetical protein PVAND_002023 [Polypedilum vanderplanki]|uniref:Hamartin n=1 Tax=Polypedilum vanderplanki TaxID=319348 RepID=A0A9J6BQ14_POLVA|nr:hypothetical protein PVAND_002023 [Polypedilum vanderplanki]